MSTPKYVDNQVPFGSRVESIKRGGGVGTAVGTYIFDSISLDRPTKAIERTDEIGNPNGFGLVDGFATGSGTLQLATKAVPVPHTGDWFSDTFDESSAGSAEQWVIASVAQPFEKDGYRKVNVTLRLSTTPPTA